MTKMTERSVVPELLFGMIVGGTVALICSWRISEGGCLSGDHQARMTASLLRMGVSVGAYLALVRKSSGILSGKDEEVDLGPALLGMAWYGMAFVTATMLATFISLTVAETLPNLRLPIGCLMDWSVCDLLSVLLRIALILGSAACAQHVATRISRMACLWHKATSVLASVSLAVGVFAAAMTGTTRILYPKAKDAGEQAAPAEENEEHDYRLTEDEPGEVIG